MRNAWSYLEPGRELKYGDLCVGTTASDDMVCVYARYRPKTKAYNKQFVPSVRVLNDELGSYLNLKFMRRHELPGTLIDRNSLDTSFVTRGQLDNVIYVLDKDTGYYYVAETYTRMSMRASRRHFLAWKRVPDGVSPTLDQRMIRSISVVSRAELNKFMLWHDELKQSEEAIHILEPNIQKQRNSNRLLLDSDFSTMIREAYLSNKLPATLLADISDRNYRIPEPPLCGVGTKVRYHSWLEKA